jgi:hypothetical protein
MGTPPQQTQLPLTAEGLATAMVTAIKAAGLGAPQGTGDMFELLDRGMTMMERFRKFGEKTQQFFEPDGPEPMQLPAPPEKEEEDSPYDITELPSQWDDGSKAKLVRDRDTGKVDMLGMALMNPRPAQRLMDAGAVFLERWGQRRGLAGPPDQQEETQFQQQPQHQQFQPPPQQQLPAPQAPQAPPPNPPGPPGEGGWGGF